MQKHWLRVFWTNILMFWLMLSFKATTCKILIYTTSGLKSKLLAVRGVPQLYERACSAKTNMASMQAWAPLRTSLSIWMICDGLGSLSALTIISRLLERM
jgi:hypothetical protein